EASDWPDLVVGRRERLHASLRHAAAEELSPESPDTALAARLVAQEIPAEAGRQAGEKLEKYYGQSAPAVRHQTSPLLPVPTAFVIIPTVVREDMSCCVNRNSGSIVLPLSL